jgi:23S rRNA (adenine2503-C2)-methyltransferase
MKPRILDLSHSQLVELICSLGEPRYRADQIEKWVYGGLARSFDEMTDLPQPFRQKLVSDCHLFTLQPVDERLSGDGQTRKVLFQLEDGKTIESAYMLYEPTETSRERRTVCVSTQVGCSIRCPFCATGQQGFERNLTAGEIVEQVLYFVWLAQVGDQRGVTSRGISGEVRDASLRKSEGVPVGAIHESPEPSIAEAEGLKMIPETVSSLPASRRALTNVVFMGMGEPLANFEAVKGAIATLNSKSGLGLGARQITVSTVGLMPQIRRLAKEDVHVELAVSLHAASDRVRNVLVPVNRKYPLRRLIEACQEYFQETGRRPTFEYALFNGINDSLDQAHKLADLLAGFDCHVNLIVGNPTPSKEFRPSVSRRVAAFQKELTDGGISNTLRQSRGADIDAGCGQLRSRRLAK